MNKLKYPLLFGAVAAIYIIYYILQPYIDYSAGVLYDGKKYLKIASYFNTENTAYSIAFPFNSRIGVPFVASFFSNHLATFSILNTIFLIPFFGILFYFLKEYAKGTFTHIAFVLLWLSLHYIGPIRYYIHDPVSIDLQTGGVIYLSLVLAGASQGRECLKIICFRLRTLCWRCVKSSDCCTRLSLVNQIKYIRASWQTQRKSTWTTALWGKT